MKANIPVDQNGNIQRPISAESLKPIIEEHKRRGRAFKMGTVFPVSSHNYELRYWLASSDIHPGFYAPELGDNLGQREADVLLNITPPPQMPATLEAGTIQGYCVGEPWNQQAVLKNMGVPVITNYEIWKNNPEKVLGVSEVWAKKYPNTHIRLIKALIRAAHWLDDQSNKNRQEAIGWLAQRQYVGADLDVLANSMLGFFEYEKGHKYPLYDFNVFFRHHATYPYYSDAIWFLTQMRRWGQISTTQSDDWYMQMAKQVYRPDIYRQAAKDLMSEGKLSQSNFPDFEQEYGFRSSKHPFMDNVIFDGTQPNDYLKKFKIGLK